MSGPRADFAAKAPGFDWTAFLGAAGLDGKATFLVSQPSAIAGSAKLIGETPLPVLKDYLWARTLDDAAPLALASAFVDANFAYHGTALDGTPQIRERWKRGVALVKNAMGEAVGEQYVARYFPPEAKAEADKLVRNIIEAMDDRLANLDLDGARDEGEGAREARRLPSADRLSGEVARLFGADDRPRRPLRQRPPRDARSSGTASSGSSASRRTATNGS